MKSRIKLRAMIEDDAPNIVAIEKVLTSAPWSEQIFRDCVKVGYSCWVFEERRKVVGYGLLSAEGGEAHVLNVCIKPEMQGKGLGLRMMRHIIRQAKKLGADTLFLEVRESNKVARNLYKKLKFIEIGCRKDYYEADKGREDAVVLALSLV